jgi:hypothetical protein
MRREYGAEVSYDLTVYVPGAVRAAQLREFISAQNTLRVGDFDDERGWVAVARGAKRRYCFTVEGPFRVEPEDVPEDVIAAVLGVTYLYSVTVEGSAEADVPHAVRFARRLSQSFGGAVVDQQTAEVWARGAARVASRPQRDERVHVVHLAWYARKQNVDDAFGQYYTRACRRLLPEALPRRYGEFEPLQGKLEAAGDEGFAQTWRDATSTVFFSARTPCLGGSISAGPSETHPSPIWDMTLEVHHEPLSDRRWRDALQQFFISIADHLCAFYASAEVTRGNIWNGRSMWVDQSTEWAISPARREGWMGLPPYPVWWAWYGTPYRNLIGSELPHGRLMNHARGALHELADAPLDRDQLTDLVTTRRGLRRRTEWVAPELVAKVQPSDDRVLPMPLRSADCIPANLF